MNLCDLVKRDVIVSRFGLNDVTMIVKNNDVERKILVFTCTNWLKKENVIKPYDYFESYGWAYVTRLSKLKWFLRF